MSVTLRLDTRQFQVAMREYMAETKRDSASALNRQARNFAIKCIQNTKPARGAAAIRALQNEPWWPRLVAKVIGTQKGAGAGSKAFQAQYVAAERARRLAAGGHKKSYMLSKEESSYAKYARKVSGQILRSRTAAISFLRFFFRVLAQRISTTTGQPVPGGKSFSGFRPSVSPASESRLTVALSNVYEFRRRGSKSAASAERLLQTAMQTGLAATVADMRDYISKRVAARSAQHSGGA